MDKSKLTHAASIVVIEGCLNGVHDLCRDVLDLAFPTSDQTTACLLEYATINDLIADELRRRAARARAAVKVKEEKAASEARAVLERFTSNLGDQS